MAHYLTNNEKFHIFSKSPVLSSMAVSQAVNKSGHTVSTNDVWADDIPWFTEVADEAGAITRAADARYNDLILWGSDIYVRKGDKTNGASTGTTFAELWEKHTDLTEARAYALGSVTTQTPTNIVAKTVEIKNASDKVVLKYHVGKQIDLLTTTNNANVASTWAARMFIDGKVVDQFVSPTDKVFAGNPSTGYTTLVYTATAAGNKYGFVSEGETDGDFVNNAFAGIVQFNQSRNSTHKFAASVFEYVGSKLDAAVSELKTAVFGGDDTDGNISLSQKVAQNTAAINTLNGADTIDGSVAKTVKDATDTLDSKINGVAATANSAIQSVTAPGATTTNTAVTIEAATLNNDNKSFNNDTYFAKAGDVVTVATTLANEVDAKLTPITELITAAQSTADEAKEIAEGAVQSAEDAAQSITDLSNTAISATSTGSDNVTVTLGGTVSAPTLSVTGTDIASAQTLTNLEQKVNDHLLDAAGKLEICVLADKLPKKPFFEDENFYVKSYGFEWEKLSNNIYPNKFEVKVAQSVDGLNEFKVNDVVLTPSPLAAQTCKLVVYSIDDDKQLTEVAVSQANTFDASTSIYAFKFDNQISLSAGARYRFCFRNNDETNALHCLPVIMNSSVGAEITKNEMINRYITGETEDDYWGCWATPAGVLNDVPQYTYGPKVSISGLTPTPNEDGKALIGENGKIYLIPNTGSENQNVYDEFVWTNDTWEKIGSTKVDLSEYAKSIKISDTETIAADSTGALDLSNYKWITGWGNNVVDFPIKPEDTGASICHYNGNFAIHVRHATSDTKGIATLTSTYNANDNTSAITGFAVASAIANLSATNIGSGAVKVSQADGVVTSVTVDTEALVSENALKTNVTNTNALITASDALAAIKLAKPENYVKSVTVGSTTTSGETALTINDGRTTVYPNDLWGTTVSMVDNTITVQGGPIDGTAWGPKNGYNTKSSVYANNTNYPKGSNPITKVENNMVYNGATEVANIKTNEIVNGYYMFYNTSLTSFTSDLSSLVNGSSMFESTSLESFSGDLSSLVNGADIFSLTSLDVESVELICDVLPNYNTENGGKQLQTATWNTDGENKGKYTYSDWTSGNYYYPIIIISEDYVLMSQGNVDDINRSFGTSSISESDVKSITITWGDISVLSEADRTAITKLFTDTATEKGWTFITNTELGGTVSPNAVMAADGTIQYYVLAKKDEATEDNATHIDASGKLWKFDTAEAIIGPNIKYWSMFATVEDALTEWELTPWTKPTEEETEA